MLCVLGYFLHCIWNVTAVVCNEFWGGGGGVYTIAQLVNQPKKKTHYMKVYVRAAEKWALVLIFVFISESLKVWKISSAGYWYSNMIVSTASRCVYVSVLYAVIIHLHLSASARSCLELCRAVKLLPLGPCGSGRQSAWLHVSSQVSGVVTPRHVTDQHRSCDLCGSWCKNSPMDGLLLSLTPSSTCLGEVACET